MLELKQTKTFRKWRLGLRDAKARAAVASRLDRLAFGGHSVGFPLNNGKADQIVNALLHRQPSFWTVAKVDRETPTIAREIRDRNCRANSTDRHTL